LFNYYPVSNSGFLSFHRQSSLFPVSENCQINVFLSQFHELLPGFEATTASVAVEHYLFLFKTPDPKANSPGLRTLTALLLFNSFPLPFFSSSGYY
jgi:hypothetical protein